MERPNLTKAAKRKNPGESANFCDEGIESSQAPAPFTCNDRKRAASLVDALLSIVLN